MVEAILDINYINVKKPKKCVTDPSKPETFDKVIAAIMKDGPAVESDKKDGFGAYVDTRFGDPRIYSHAKTRWNPECLPELIPRLKELRPGLYVGELHGAGNLARTDQRKYVISRDLNKPHEDLQGLIRDMPLTFSAYDAFEIEGKVLVENSLESRLKELHSSSQGAIELIPHTIITDKNTLIQRAIQEYETGGEGLVVKALSSQYGELTKTESGLFGFKATRNADWWKIKDHETFDLAVIGVYHTPNSKKAGKQASNFLAAVYNNQTGQFETLVKVTANKKEIVAKVMDQIGPYLRPTFNHADSYRMAPENANQTPNLDEQIQYSSKLMTSRSRGIRNKVPDQYVENPRENAAVIEVKGEKISRSKSGWHSCANQMGLTYSIDQAEMIGYRDDKSPLDASTTIDIHNQFIESYGN